LTGSFCPAHRYVLAFVAMATMLRRALICTKIFSVKIFIYLGYKVLSSYQKKWRKSSFLQWALQGYGWPYIILITHCLHLIIPFAYSCYCLLYPLNLDLEQEFLSS